VNGAGLLCPAFAAPLLDGITPVFVCAGSDPRNSPGLDLPPGSICFVGGLGWFEKIDTAATDWQATPFGGSGSSGPTVATWTIGTTTPRFFAIDPANGNDAHAGFSDVSAAAAWAVAKKTWAGFVAIFPNIGAGRSAEVLVGPAVLGEALLFSGRNIGYQELHIVGTTDGSDDAADRILSGAAVGAVGPGTGGVWTCVAGGTTTDIKVAAGLPSSTGANTARIWRARFAANTTTVALRNVCCGIFQNTATDITPMDVLPAAPAAGDTFFIERPGVVFTTVTMLGTPAAAVIRLRGIAAAATSAPWTLGQNGGTLSVTFCESRDIGGSSVVSGVASYNETRTYFNLNGGTSPTLGVGFRSGGQRTISSIGSLSGNNSGTVIAAAHPTFASAISRCPFLSYGQGCVYFGPLQVKECGVDTADVADSLTGSVFGGATTTFHAWEVSGASGNEGLAIEACKLLVRDGSASPDTGQNFPCVSIAGVGNDLEFSNIAGTSAGAGLGSVGFSVNNCRDSNLRFASCTAAGATGALRLSGDALPTYADLTKTNIRDNRGNNIEGSAGTIVGQCTLTTCRAADGLSAGSLCHFVATGVNASARNDVFASAKCNAVAVMTAGQGSPIYVVTPAAGAAPYVLSETVVIGGMAYVGLYAGGNAKANSNAANAGEFETAVGVWIDGADNSSGHLAWNPDQWPSFVDVLAVVGSANGDGLPFLIPDNMAAVQYVSLETGKAAGDEVSLGFTNSRIDIFLKATANPNEFVTRWFDAGSGHNTTVRVKWAFR
jgi:hypothetical protein